MKKLSLIIFLIISTELVAQPTEERIQQFIISNTVSAFLHEAGHMLMWEYDLPVLGREEDAADSFQNWYMIVTRDYFPDDDSYNYYADFFHPMVEDTADYYYFSEKLGYDKEVHPWDWHSPNQVRYFQALCIMADGNPKLFENYLKKRGMTMSSMKQCEASYYYVDYAWDKVMGEYVRTGENDKYNGKFIIKYEPTNQYDYYRDLIESSSILEHDLLTNPFYFQLINDIPVIFKECGYINAEYLPNEKQITICYEYLEFVEHLIVEGSKK